MNRLLERMFQVRGYDTKYLTDIFSCSHQIPKDTDTLCQALYGYWQRQDLLIVMTDVDMDGIMTGLMAYAGLSELGFRVALYCPDTNFGYGFDGTVIQQLVSKYPDAKGILTGDVGVTCHDGVSCAKQYGLDIFVTDHHVCPNPVNATVVVDPQRVDDLDSYDFICGAYVMYQVLRYYAEYYAMYPGIAMAQIDRLRVFAGIATISDGMPLYHENRRLVQDAVRFCRMMYQSPYLVDLIEGCEVYRRVFLGLLVLLQEFQNYGKISSVTSISEDFFGYYVGPAFNSLKRLGGDITLAYLVFFGGKHAAEDSIHTILDLTEERKFLTESYYQSMMQGLQPWKPYIYVTDAPHGIRGLLAQKAMSVLGHPVLVVAENEDGSYSGSGRCPDWFPFLDLTNDHSNGYWWAAGHNAAFGVGTDGNAGLDALLEFFQEEIPVRIPDDSELEYVPDFVISTLGDGDVDLDIDLFRGFLYELEAWRPFGRGFEKPSCLLRCRREDVSVRLIGASKNHVRLELDCGFSVVCFHQGVLFDDTIPLEEQLPEIIEVIGSLNFNHYLDVITVQMMGTIQWESQKGC